MAIPNPYPNIADDVKSDVTTYSSNKIESLISAATELPTPESGDAGKVLTVNASEDGYELDALATVATTGAYSDLSGTPEIPTVPTLTAIDKDDMFVDSTNITSFIAYRYGKIVIVLRCALGNLTFDGSAENNIIQLKDEYVPIDAAGVRIMMDDGSSNTPIRLFLDGGTKKIHVNSFTSTSTAAFFYAYTYVIA